MQGLQDSTAQWMSLSRKYSGLEAWSLCRVIFCLLVSVGLVQHLNFNFAQTLLSGPVLFHDFSPQCYWKKKFSIPTLVDWKAVCWIYEGLTRAQYRDLRRITKDSRAFWFCPKLLSGTRIRWLGCVWWIKGTVPAQEREGEKDKGRIEDKRKIIKQWEERGKTCTISYVANFYVCSRGTRNKWRISVSKQLDKIKTMDKANLRQKCGCVCGGNFNILQHGVVADL